RSPQCRAVVGGRATESTDRTQPLLQGIGRRVLMLFHVYKEDVPEGYYVNEPFGIYRTLLDADWLLWALLPFLLIIVVIVLMVGWRMHEIPKHRAEHKKMRQAEVVSALTLL